MTEIHGIAGAPYSTPQTRRKLPAPFQRPSITVGAAREIKRTWKDVAVVDLREGDVIAGFGKIASIEENVDIKRRPSAWWFVISNVLHDVAVYGGHDRVFAFAGEDLT